MRKKLLIAIGNMLLFWQRLRAYAGSARQIRRILLGSAFQFADSHWARMKSRNTLLAIVGAIVLGVITVAAVTRPSGGTSEASRVTAATPAPTTEPSPTPVQATATVRPTDVPPTATVRPTDVPPTATPTPFTFPPASQIANVDVGGLRAAEAQRKVQNEMDRYRRTVVLRTEGYSTTLRTANVLKIPSARSLVERAREHGNAKEPAQVAVERPALEQFVKRIAVDLDQPPAAASVVSDTKSLTQTFTFTMRPGRRLDVNQAVERIAQEVVRPTGAKEIDLQLVPAAATRPPMAELERVLRQHATMWNGIAAFYVKDLQTGETVAINADTAFSGASVMKAPIMIFAYSRLGGLNEEQRGAMEKMILASDNLAANDLLAAGVGGAGTEAALHGVNEMTAMLKSLGLQHTYQLIPYESVQWLTQVGLFPPGGPVQEGQPPFTAADRWLRTTPHEMGEVFVMLDQCAKSGTGPLIEKVGGKLNQALCNEMVDWLARPHDQERMAAGLPPGTKVAHKGGWIDDMQSDVGIVESPGGRYVAAIYVWRNGYVTDENASPSPFLGDFSHTIYSFFNPRPLAQP
jgi:beta-lactamase class A